MCGVCGGPWVKRTGENWGCGIYRYGQACTNNRLVNTERYENWVLADLKRGMLAPEAVSAYVRAYHRDFARQAAELGRERERIERQLLQADKRMQRLLDALVDGGSIFPEIQERLAAARRDKDRLSRELASSEAVPNVLALHPHIEDAYRAQVAGLEQALKGDDARLEAIPRLRALISRIIVRPNPEKKRGVVVEVVRQMDEILNLATATDIAKVKKL